MRFIILAPILCLLAIVAAYPIQQTKEPAEVTQNIYRRGDSLSGPTITWRYRGAATRSSPGVEEAKEAARRIMKRALKQRLGGVQTKVDNEKYIILFLDMGTGWWSGEGQYSIQTSAGDRHPVIAPFGDLYHVDPLPVSGWKSN